MNAEGETWRQGDKEIQGQRKTVSFCLGRCNENVNADVRRLLDPLTTLAAARRLAIVVVTHLRKGDGFGLQRAMGSTAFAATARAAWFVVRDPDRSERRLLLPAKNNLA